MRLAFRSQVGFPSFALSMGWMQGLNHRLDDRIYERLGSCGSHPLVHLNGRPTFLDQLSISHILDTPKYVLYLRRTAISSFMFSIKWPF